MSFSEIIHLLRAKLGEQLATQFSEEDNKPFLSGIRLEVILLAQCPVLPFAQLSPVLALEPHLLAGLH